MPNRLELYTCRSREPPRCNPAWTRESGAIMVGFSVQCSYARQLFTVVLKSSMLHWLQGYVLVQLEDDSKTRFGSRGRRKPDQGHGAWRRNGRPPQVRRQFRNRVVRGLSTPTLGIPRTCYAPLCMKSLAHHDHRASILERGSRRVIRAHRHARDPRFKLDPCGCSNDLSP